MGFLDKFISKLEDNDQAQCHHQGQNQRQHHQPQYQYQLQPQYGQHTSHPMNGYEQISGFGGGGDYQAGQGYVHPPPPPSQQQVYGQGQGYGHIDPNVIRTQTAQSLLQAFQTQLSTAQMRLDHGPAYDEAFRVKMEMEVKVLSAVVGVCKGFVAGYGEGGLGEGLKGLDLGRGHSTDPYAQSTAVHLNPPHHPLISTSTSASTSTSDKEKEKQKEEDKKKLILSIAGAGVVGLGAGLVLGDGDSDGGGGGEREDAREREDREDRESGSENGSGSSSNEEEYEGGDDE